MHNNNFVILIHISAGLGRIFGDGQANITFCSNNANDVPDEMFDGFVIRATCLNPAEYYMPGCTDLAFFQAWDPEFTNIINLPLAEVCVCMTA